MPGCWRRRSGGEGGGRCGKGINSMSLSLKKDCEVGGTVYLLVRENYGSKSVRNLIVCLTSTPYPNKRICLAWSFTGLCTNS
jgi:hypothetical protein